MNFKKRQKHKIVNLDDVQNRYYVEFDGVNDNIQFSNGLLFPVVPVDSVSYALTDAHFFKNTAVSGFWYYSSNFSLGSRDSTIEVIIKDFAINQSGIGYLVIEGADFRIGFNGNSSFYWNVRGTRYTDSVANIQDVWQPAINGTIIKTNWNYIRFEYNATTRKRAIYVNNVFYAETTNLVDVNNSNRATWAIGSSTNYNNTFNGSTNFGTAAFFNGKVSSVSIYQRLLTSEETVHRYNGGAFNTPLNKTGALRPLHWFELDNNLRDFGSNAYSGKCSGFIGSPFKLL